MKTIAFAALLLLANLTLADVVDDVRSTLAAGNFSTADSALNSYRAQHGVDPAYLEALSWMARGALAARQLDQAQKYADQTESLVRQQLQHRALDSEPHLPVALGSALEVESQVLAERGQNAKAVALLRRGLTAYGNTSIRARLQKNLNQLSLTGQSAPPLSTTQYLGVRPISAKIKILAAVCVCDWVR